MADRSKRGISGQANAKAHPWRMNGRLADWQARALGATHVPPAPSSGSVTMRGMLGGLLAAKLGFPMPKGNYDRMLDHAQPRCTHPLFRDEPIADAAE